MCHLPWPIDLTIFQESGEFIMISLFKVNCLFPVIDWPQAKFISRSFICRWLLLKYPWLWQPHSMYWQWHWKPSEWLVPLYGHDNSYLAMLRVSIDILEYSNLQMSALSAILHTHRLGNLGSTSLEREKHFWSQLARPAKQISLYAKGLRCYPTCKLIVTWELFNSTDVDGRCEILESETKDFITQGPLGRQNSCLYCLKSHGVAVSVCCIYSGLWYR